MTIERFMLDGFRDEDTYEALRASDSFPLVRELEFKYGLKVIRSKSIREPKDFRDVTGWLMSRSDGVPIATAFSFIKDKKVTYAVYVNNYRKSRAFDEHDRSILSSTKVSQLMSSIARANAMPSQEKITKKILSNTSAVDVYKNVKRGKRKDVPFNADEIHALLARVLGENTDGKSLPLDLDKCKKTLDVFNDHDRMKAEMERECDKLFRNPFLIVGVHDNGEALAGKAVFEGADQYDNSQYKLVEPLKRYRSAADIEGFKALMTMIKVKYEGSARRTVGGFLPVSDIYDDDLQMAFYFSMSPDEYNCAWVAVPCTT